VNSGRTRDRARNLDIHVFPFIDTWLIASGKKGVRKGRGIGTWDLVGGWGAVTPCVTHEAEKGGKALMLIVKMLRGL
jgi:hypothetical protein